MANMITEYLGNRLVFSDVVRTDGRTKRHRESLFDFLDRNSWERTGRIRDLIEICAANYPAVERGEVISRIQAKSESGFSSAVFEFLLHEMLIRLGYKLTPRFCRKLKYWQQKSVSASRFLLPVFEFATEPVLFS